MITYMCIGVGYSYSVWPLILPSIFIAVPWWSVCSWQGCRGALRCISLYSESVLGCIVPDSCLSQLLCRGHWIWIMLIGSISWRSGWGGFEWSCISCAVVGGRCRRQSVLGLWVCLLDQIGFWIWSTTFGWRGRGLGWLVLLKVGLSDVVTESIDGFVHVIWQAPRFETTVGARSEEGSGAWREW